MAWDGLTGVRLRAMAPEALAALDAVAAAVSRCQSPFVQLARPRIAGALGLDEFVAGTPAAPPRSAALSAAGRAAVEFAEQFAVDVGSVSLAQRGALDGALGPGVFEFVQALYAIDSDLRVRAALRQIFGVDVPAAGDPKAVVALWPALQEWMRQVARLGALDPLTTELVRLRGARAHNCRLCKSRRHVAAVEEGADEAVLAQIDQYETSGLSERHKVALRLTDAMIWEPSAYPRQLAGDIRARLSPAEALEVVFDVARNAANKIAVALGADQANVVEGVEYFDTDEWGEIVLGVTPSRTRSAGPLPVRRPP